MSERGIFAVPTVSAARTKAIGTAVQYLCEERDLHRDPRDMLQGLVDHCGAKITYPSYRTGLRCGDIYSEGATSCGLATAKLLIGSFEEKASRYLLKAGARK